MNRPSFYWWLPLGVITAAFLSFFLFRSPYLLGPDGYFHITYAKLLLHHGLFYAFPWASLSMWSERFSDKDLLYHFLLIPFSQFQDLQFGAKCSALFFAMGVAFFLWYWMKRENVSQIWFWTFCLFFGSPNFLFRILSPRPHTLGLLFFLLGIFALIESRWILLFCVSFFYPWAHSSWLLVVPMSALVAFSQSVQQRMFVWKPFAIACLGATLGMVIHPYFPENWHYFYVQSIHTLYMGISHSQDLGMAGEFSSYSLREFFLTNSVPLFFFCYALVGLIRDRSAYRQINLALVALTTIVMTITVRRFIELSMPMMVIFAALQLSLHKDIDRRKVVFGVLGILLSFSLQHPWTNFER
ncbi:MAG: hypothetical protein KDD60_05465, partial [Bdellovibrionales bacterium]|nr:hypothetical protein [Bdellovibrionales bacterium]